MTDYKLAKELAEYNMSWHDDLPLRERLASYAGKYDNDGDLDLTWNRQHRRPKHSGMLKPIQLKRIGLMR